MDPSAIITFLDTLMTNPTVHGALVIDSTTGLSLGARGKATDDDASYLSLAAREAVGADGLGVCLFRDCRVLLRKGEGGVLIAVYKEKGMEAEE